MFIELVILGIGVLGTSVGILGVVSSGAGKLDTINNQQGHTGTTVQTHEQKRIDYYMESEKRTQAERAKCFYESKMNAIVPVFVQEMENKKDCYVAKITYPRGKSINIMYKSEEKFKELYKNGANRVYYCIVNGQDIEDDNCIVRIFETEAQAIEFLGGNK